MSRCNFNFAIYVLQNLKHHVFFQCILDALKEVNYLFQ